MLPRPYLGSLTAIMVKKYKSNLVVDIAGESGKMVWEWIKIRKYLLKAEKEKYQKNAES